MGFWNKPATSEEADQQMRWIQTAMDRLGDAGGVNSPEMKYLTAQHREQFKTREELRKQEGRKQ